ncbi:hypothetical protein ZIOFF_068219 [Zingiber officinale]|uniref:Leucine-rich repeat-containing N-terminal plant-type domain-containing protein n=1 Tax=Zingiber officinale TaxID=94328 RepID=A0A8J5CY03_ZINOF|nr:hypothetical protein ZIOFF_068219 [Zingiber officinale]
MNELSSYLSSFIKDLPGSTKKPGEVQPEVQVQAVSVKQESSNNTAHPPTSCHSPLTQSALSLYRRHWLWPGFGACGGRLGKIAVFVALGSPQGDHLFTLFSLLRRDLRRISERATTGSRCSHELRIPSPEWNLAFKYWLLCVMTTLVCMSMSNTITPDGEVLLSIKTAIVGSDVVFLNWRQEDPDPCSWKGVSCDSNTKRVTHVRLAYHKLIGSISPEIGKLNHLKLLLSLGISDASGINGWTAVDAMGKELFENQTQDTIDVVAKHEHDHVDCEGCVDIYNCPFPICDFCHGSKLHESGKVAEMVRSSSFAIYGRYQI